MLTKRDHRVKIIPMDNTLSMTTLAITEWDELDRFAVPHIQICGVNVPLTTAEKIKIRNILIRKREDLIAEMQKLGFDPEN
jgi:hypothetical protein